MNVFFVGCFSWNPNILHLEQPTRLKSLINMCLADFHHSSFSHLFFADTCRYSDRKSGHGASLWFGMQPTLLSLVYWGTGVFLETYRPAPHAGGKKTWWRSDCTPGRVGSDCSFNQSD